MPIIVYIDYQELTMAINDNYAPDVSVGNGVTTVFTGSWKVINATYFKCLLRLVSTGAETLQAQGTDYTLTFDDSGYSIEFVTAPSALYEVVRYREVTIDQQNPYRTAKGFQGAVLENSLDKITAILQDLDKQIDSCLKFPLSETTVISQLPSASSRATSVLGFTASGALTTYAVDLDGTIIPPPSSEYGRVIMSQFGADPANTEAENTAALQDGIDFIATMMGGNGEIFFDIEGEYDINTATRTGGIYNIVFNSVPGVTLNGANVDYSGDNALVMLSGTALTTTTVTSAITLGSTVWQVASTAGLEAGMPFYIRSNTEYFNGASGVSGFSQVPKFEVNRIKSVDSSTQITVQNGAETDYSVTGHTITLTPYTAIESVIVTPNIFWKGGGIKDTLENGTGQIAIRVDLFDSLDFSGMRAGGWQNSVSLGRIGTNANVAGGWQYGLDDQMPATNFYGHLFDGVKDCNVEGVFGRNMRRLCDSGTLYISRDFHMHSNIGEHMNGSGVGSHHGDRFYIYDNILNDVESITNRAKNSHVWNNSITSRGAGIQFGSASVAAPTSINNMGKCSARNNRVKTAAGGTTRYGLQLTLGYDEFINENNTYETESSPPVWIQCYQINNYKASGNTFKTNSGTADGHVIDNSTSIMTSIDGVDIGRNTFIGNFDEVIKIAAPNSGSFLQNISIESQRVVGSFATMYSIDRSRTGTFINIASGQLADGAHSGFRNMIVNGSGLVNERQGDGADVTSTTAYPLDRWALTAAGQSLRLNQNTSSLPTDDVSGWLRIQTRLAPAGAPAAGEKYALEQAIIGYDFAHLKWGTNNALPVTVAFFVRPVVNTSGNSTYSFAIQNGARDRSYVKNYVGNNGNVRLIISTIPGDKSGTWATDATAGARLVLDLGSGSNFETTADTWAAGNFIRTSGSYRIIEDNQFRTITFGGVSMERGANFSGFERRPFAIERELCKPFFQRRGVHVPVTASPASLPIDMLAVPSISGGDIGFSSTNTTAGVLIYSQTTASFRTLLLDAEPSF
jgi:hypothetical protein